MRNRGAHHASVVLTAVALVAFAAPCRAETFPRLSVDWDSLFAKDSIFVRRSAERAEPRSKRSDEASARRGEPENGKVFAVVPRMSLVARDWAGARRLAGGQLSLTDAIGLSHSSRMVVGRLRFGDGDTAFVPFGQVGFGQWRADPALMPPGLRDTELASQIGIGFELRLAKNWQLAAETDLTVLYREQRERQNVAGPRMLAAFVGSRAVF